MTEGKKNESGPTRRAFVLGAAASTALALAPRPKAAEMEGAASAPVVDWTDTVMIERGCHGRHEEDGLGLGDTEQGGAW